MLYCCVNIVLAASMIAVMTAEISGIYLATALSKSEV